MNAKKTFELDALLRPNIRNLKPYSSARDEFHGQASVFLDANENPYNAPYNRYPDPMQWRLKERIARIKGVPVTSIFLGNGSDEPIDLLIRAFCEPEKDKIMVPDPTYGMYQVAADINGVTCVKVPLRTDFSLDLPKMLAQIDASLKLIYLCSPNNPTGNSLEREAIASLLGSFSGIVVVDEAYIDFSSEASWLEKLEEYPNLVVLQTLSKAWGAAAIRLGMAFASPELVSVLSRIKYPYNINQLTQEKAIELLDERRKDEQLARILHERGRLIRALASLPVVKRIYPTDANFLLVDVGEADAVYNRLVAEGIIVRNRNNVTLCQGCLRITVGTEDENTALLNALQCIVP